jgi:DNA-binding NtrC family response regulator
MGMRVLIVDDERMIRLLLEGALRSEGYDVESAADGKRALELMAQRKFHIVVSDLMMPVMDGRELLHRIQDEHPLTRVIVMTGAATIDNMLSCLREGAFAFVTKPFGDIAVVIHQVHIAAWTVQGWMEQLVQLQRLNNKVVAGVPRGEP